MRKRWRQQRKRVRRLLQKWTYLCGLRWWKVTARFVVDREPHDAELGTCLFGSTVVFWQYMWASIEINLYAVVQRTDKELEEDIVHELVHVLVNELREPDEDGKHEDRVCTTVTKALLWAHTLQEEQKDDQVQGSRDPR